MNVNSKTISRFAVVQLIYHAEFTLKYVSDICNNPYDDIDPHVQNLIFHFYKSKDINEYFGLKKQKKIIPIKPSYKYLRNLIQYIVYNRLKLYEIVKDIVGSKTEYNKMSILLRVIVLVAIADMIYMDLPSKEIIVSEYTNIASELVSISDVNFVNALIDKYLKSIK